MSIYSTRVVVSRGTAGRLVRVGAVAYLLSLAGCEGGLWFDPAAGLLWPKDAARTGALADASDVSTFPIDLPGGDAYELVDLGPSVAGDHWTFFLQSASMTDDAIVIALFDGDLVLQSRSRITARNMLQHVLRHNTQQLYAGLQSSRAARFALVAARRQVAVPAPQGQIVWLNFSGAAGLRINTQPAVSFGPFEARAVDPAYAGQSELMMAEITRTLRDLYSGFDVTILSSAETPEPGAPHSTIHFGGYDSAYLGVGETIDRYNANPADQAIVYTQSFARYATMALTAEEMARMIGNTAGHELGHLLGLVHTRGSDNVMDDTRTAWELAAESFVAPAPLAETVFPVGVEDATAVLAETVGRAR
jgi:hypothetical protein